MNILKYLTVAATVLLIPLGWWLLRAGDPKSLPTALQSAQENVAAKSCKIDSPCEVAIDDLLGTPEIFHETYIMTSGVLRLEFEGNSLFDNRQDSSEFRTRSAVWLNLTESQIRSAPQNFTEVSVTGLFRGKRNSGNYRVYGHGGGWPAEIDVVKINEDGS